MARWTARTSLVHYEDRLPGLGAWSTVGGVAEAPRPPTNGAMNTLLACDAPAHDWYRFVLSFPPHLVRDYAGRFELADDAVVLDPFCGTGTTLVEAKKMGIAGIGVEAMPMAKFAAQVKTDWEPDPDGLANHANLVAEKALASLTADGLSDELGVPTRENQQLRSLDSDAAKLLIKDSISPLPLHKALVLREALDGERAAGFTDHEQLAFARVLPTEVGNLRFGPEVGVGSLRDDAAVVALWLNRVLTIADDLRILGAQERTSAMVVPGDARDVASCVPVESVDAVITSPPYPNEKDYSRTVRLESVLLGYLTDRPSLRSTKRELLRSNTRGVYRDDDDSAWVADDERVQDLATQIEERRIALGKDSGFERMYHRVTKLYFGGMTRHLSSLRDVLRPGARLAYVVGDQASYLRVMIRTGQILADIAERAGYEVEGIDLFRTRPATATRDQLREEVLLLRWPGPRGR
ncbi:DNA methyltransferase [Candidatus Poriferisodalis sp.]|uniref:DNA methyltransferase n=1 Tax=Candidatus Poriferisodalis sp. TaxID=3101277 RepID=UPI003B0148E0